MIAPMPAGRSSVRYCARNADGQPAAAAQCRPHSSRTTAASTPAGWRCSSTRTPQGGVTESGIVATVMLIPAAAFAPVMASLGAPCRARHVAVAGIWCTGGHERRRCGGPLRRCTQVRRVRIARGACNRFHDDAAAQSALTPSLARTPEELTATNVASGWIESIGIFVGSRARRSVLAIGSEAMVFATRRDRLPHRSSDRGATSIRRRGTGLKESATDGSDARLVGALEFVRRDPQARLLSFYWRGGRRVRCSRRAQRGARAGRAGPRR